MSAGTTASGRAGGSRRGLRRVGAGVADQLLYSASNFALTVVVARETTTEGFGIFALLLISNTILVAVSRGLTSEPMIVRFSASDAGALRRATSAAGGAAVVGGLVSCVGFLVVASIGSGEFGRSALAFAVVVPGLFVQDFLRYAAIAAKRPSVALCNDAVQVALQFTGIFVLLGMGHSSPAAMVLAWGGSAYVGAVVGAVLLHTVPRVDRALRWWREEWTLASRYAIDDLGSVAGPNAAAYVVAAVSGFDGPAALRGAQTVFGPPSILNLSLQVAFIPELVRSLQRSPKLMARRALWIGLAMAAFAAVWGVAALFVPDRIGRAAFGDTWAIAQPLIVFYLINQVAAGIRQTSVLGLRALGAARRTLIARFMTLGVLVVSQLIGALTDGAHGVAVAAAISGPVMAATNWWQYRLALREYQPGTAVPAASVGATE